MNLRKSTIVWLAALAIVVVFATFVWHLAGASFGDEALHFHCGAGLRPVIDEIVERFVERTGIKVRVDYNASSLSLGRIQVSRSGDLFMPGDVHYLELAEREGLIEESWPVASFVPVILVAAGNPKDIQTVSDLTRQGLRLGLADPRTAAIGRTARLIFEKNGIPEAAIAKNLVYESVTVHDLANAIELGHLDAAIVWEPIAKRMATAIVVRIPPASNVVAPVPLAILADSQRKQAARTFVNFVLSAEAAEVFRRHHYRE